MEGGMVIRDGSDRAGTGGGTGNRLCACTLRLVVAAAFTVMMGAASVRLAQAEEATCEDLYQIYKTCYDGGQQMDQTGCDYLVQALGPRLMGEADVSGFSAALSVGMCKRGCEDGASGKKPMSMSEFRREFCGKVIK